MNIRTQILVVVLAVVALLWIIRKICRKGIEVKYSLLWILLVIGVIIFACMKKFKLHTLLCIAISAAVGIAVGF